MKYNYSYRNIKVKSITMEKVDAIREYMNGKMGYSMNKSTCIDFIAAHVMKLIMKLVEEKTKAQDHGNK